jgi:FixJ family two-component response regulator
MVDRPPAPLPPSPPPEDSVVYIIDDDASIRETLSSLFRSVGQRVETFSSAPDLLQTKLPEVVSCLVLDVRLPGVSGLALQAELAAAGIQTPVIFITGHGDIPMSVGAMKAGAFDFLTKPFRTQDLLDAVARALERDRKRRQHDREVSALRLRYDSLSPREQQVMRLVTAGLMNKQAAAEVGLSEITVKIHRGNMMRKMAARSLIELVKMAEALALHSAKH